MRYLIIIVIILEGLSHLRRDKLLSVLFLCSNPFKAIFFDIDGTPILERPTKLSPFLVLMQLKIKRNRPVLGS